ncbi:MAG: hypothetical protein L6408_08650 [Nanoarchaeota archaeon]|nr:hypothetical protein [Nanoarchaeota archaeon]
MKLPKTFRPEKDLDYKTNQLLEEPKPITGKKDVLEPYEELIYELNQKNWNTKLIHEKTNELIVKCGYKDLLPKKEMKLPYQYWSKTNTENIELTDILVRKEWDQTIIKDSYSFATVEKQWEYEFMDQFDKFCYIKQENLEISSHSYARGFRQYSFSLNGLIGGFGLGPVINYALNIPYVSSVPILSFSTGVLIGLSSFFLFTKHAINYKRKKHMKKRLKAYEDAEALTFHFEFDDKLALEKAFQP